MSAMSAACTVLLPSVSYAVCTVLLPSVSYVCCLYGVATQCQLYLLSVRCCYIVSAMSAVCTVLLPSVSYVCWLYGVATQCLLFCLWGGRTKCLIYMQSVRCCYPVSAISAVCTVLLPSVSYICSLYGVATQCQLYNQFAAEHKACCLFTCTQQIKHFSHILRCSSSLIFQVYVVLIDVEYFYLS
jgi:hypothetical protein